MVQQQVDLLPVCGVSGGHQLPSGHLTLVLQRTDLVVMMLPSQGVELTALIVVKN